MTEVGGLFAEICVAILGIATVGMHLSRRNVSEARLYVVQSLAVVALLAYPLFNGHYSTSLLAVAVLTFLVKVIAAPAFFGRMIRKHEVRFTAKTYANVPETLILLALIMIMAGSHVFDPLANIVPANSGYLTFAITSMFMSLFLMINRSGALSQVIGALSLENSIVAFAVLAGLEQSPVLQIGIIFDITIWLIVATVMLSMVHTHHGSLDVSKMKKLKD